jgi:tetratricopeptide (TPR) repeat protein
VDRIFISHSSKDNAEVKGLAEALQGLGFEVWLDQFELHAGDDFVSAINTALHDCTASIIVFSQHTEDSRWVKKEVSYLIWAATEEGKTVIPIRLHNDAWIPPLLRPSLFKSIDDVAAIANALRGKPASPAKAREAGVERVLISLRQGEKGSTKLEVHIGGSQYAKHTYDAFPAELIAARETFQRGFRTGIRRSPMEAERSSLESGMAELGRALCSFCLRDSAGDALANLVDGCKVGTTVEVVVEAEGAELLALPYEALRLPDDRLLATHPAVVMLRRPAGVEAAAFQPLAGPLKILVAVGAPDEGQSAGAVLDLEHELQNILDAVAPAQRRDDVEVRILEVGNPAVIGAALEQDAYHVLHISCHGLPGRLQMEDEDGGAVGVTAEQLLEPMRKAGRHLPMVLLSSCHGGSSGKEPEGRPEVQQRRLPHLAAPSEVGQASLPAAPESNQHAQETASAGQAASMAEALLRNGVPCVLAMQTSVSDFYATELAHAFYQHLAGIPLPSRALAHARKELEQARQKAIGRGADLRETQPEYAIAGLFVAGAERPLVDAAAGKQPLRVRPVLQVAGPVPQLRIDDLIGRRKELRQALRTLRDETGQHAGVVLTGIGGVGKSSVAGRIMQRLSEGGWLVPAHAGRFDLAGIALSIGVALQTSSRPSQYGEMLCKSDLDDRVRLQLVAKVLAEEHVLLVLDDFEQNLKTGGGEFLDPDLELYLGLLTKSARRGRLLITCRYPVPGTEGVLDRVSIGPLSTAEVRKLILRLPGLRGLDSKELGAVLRVIGGHPRMLEFLDALLRGGKGRLPHVTTKLREVLKSLDPSGKVQSAASLDERVQQALLLGARDVFLSELLEIARHEKLDEVLLQTAVSNLPVSAAGVARMLADGDRGDEAAAQQALARLEDLSLVYRFPHNEVWVHRWTAEGLAGLVDAATHREGACRAGRYRWWRVGNESHSLEDAIESVRNFLTGQDYGPATGIAKACFEVFRRSQRSAGIAALASEVLESLPQEDGDYFFIGDEEARAHLALGSTDRALARHTRNLAIRERRAQAEPNRADYQRDLSVSYQRVGDLYRDLGQGEQAREAYLQSLAIFERLAQAEPGRADYQRDLSVSYERVGDLYRGLGHGEQARDYYLKSLDIWTRLGQAEPDRADYKKGVCVPLDRLGDLYSDLGQGEQARQAYLQSLAIAERLAQAEPDRADYQRDLSVSYNKVGDLYSDLGQGEQAREFYMKDLAIAERLAQAEPDRADYQRDLSVSYNKVGDLYSALGQGEQARQAFLQSLAIRERLAQAEPDRADYQRDLVVSHVRLGGPGEPNAAQHLGRAVKILEAMNERGQLMPVDEKWIAVYRERLDQLQSGE